MDNLKEKGPQDRTRIAFNESWEVKYWTETLNVSKEKLKEAINKVGNSVDKVKEYLKK